MSFKKNKESGNIDDQHITAFAVDCQQSKFAGNLDCDTFEDQIAITLVWKRKPWFK